MTKIVEAIATGGGGGAAGKKISSKDIDTAVQQAIMDCNKKGITDPEKIKAAMHAARKKVVEGEVKSDDE